MGLDIVVTSVQTAHKTFQKQSLQFGYKSEISDD